ncbi:MAG: tRNA (adenosine(37)-N6)-threonylcarbamoyltransferase complex dimerization subunit type 1 TsaB [Oscillospiraceae bacterium]
MKILAFETSAKSASVAVTRDGAVLASAYQCSGLTHSRTLMPMAEDMLRNSGLALAEMDALAVAAGPGSFTGLRIGVAAVKGLAWAAEKPCCAVSTLEGMAENLRHLEDTLVICAMDARREQIYNALFFAKNGTLRRLSPDRAIGLAELLRELQGDELRGIGAKVVLGDGAELCHRALAEGGVICRLAPPQLLRQNAVGVALAAERKLAAGESVSAQELAPVYLRLSQAERERLAREKPASQN